MENNDFDDDFENDFDLKFSREISKTMAMVCISSFYLFTRVFYTWYTIPATKRLLQFWLKTKKGVVGTFGLCRHGLGGAMKSNVDNEIEILKSRTLVESTVETESQD
jgi:hypothetical protein